MSLQQLAVDQLSNPFASRTSVPTFAQCIWDVLRDYPDGLSVAQILDQVQSRGLRDLSGLKKPTGQVANTAGSASGCFDTIYNLSLLWEAGGEQSWSAPAALSTYRR